MNSQHAHFVFKLRQNIALEGDLKLAEMELSAFLPNGIKPLAQMTEIAPQLPQLAVFDGLSALDSHVRNEWADELPQNGVQGYTATAPLSLLPDLIRRLTFIQRIYAVTQNTEGAQPSPIHRSSLLTQIENTLGPVIACRF